MFTRISKPFMLFLLLLVTSCGPQASALHSPPTALTQLPTPASKNEQVYPYYLPLVTKPDIESQTINGITAVIDWVYVDESRVALQYTVSNLDWPDGVMLDATSVQVSSTTIENIGYGGSGGGAYRWIKVRLLATSTSYCSMAH